MPLFAGVHTDFIDQRVFIGEEVCLVNLDLNEVRIFGTPLVPLPSHLVTRLKHELESHTTLSLMQRFVDDPSLLKATLAGTAPPSPHSDSVPGNIPLRTISLTPPLPPPMVTTHSAGGTNSNTNGVTTTTTATTGNTLTVPTTANGGTSASSITTTSTGSGNGGSAPSTPTSRNSAGPAPLGDDDDHPSQFGQFESKHGTHQTNH
jgi:hypothetical protein